MDGIQTGVTHTQTKWDKAKKHAVNAGVTCAGVAGIGVPTVYYSAESACDRLKSPMLKKIFKSFSSLGEKLFPKYSIVDVMLTDMYHEKRDLIGAVKTSKGLVTLWGAAAMLLSGVLAHGIYKAGKINGEGK